MARGTPDWGEYAKQETFPKGFDLNELAVRLGSSCAWTRTGTVYFIEDWSSGMYRWSRAVNPPNHLTMCRIGSLFSPWALQFDLSKTPSEQVYLSKSFPLFLDSPIGFEVYPQFIPYIGYFSIEAWVTKSGYKYGYGVRLNMDSNALQIYSGSSGYVNLYSPMNLNQRGAFNHLLKMVMDFKAGRYKTIYLDNRVFDVSSYTPTIAASSYNDGMELYMLAKQPDNRTAKFYVGGVVITQNE